MKNLNGLLLVVFICQISVAQPQVYLTEKNIGATPRFTSYKLPLANDYSYLIQDRYHNDDPNRHIIVLDMQHDISAYKRMKSGELTKRDSLQLERLDSKYSGTLDINHFLVLEVFDSLGYRYMTPDLNHNSSFTDEVPFVFDLSKETKVKYEDNIVGNELRYKYQGVYDDSLRDIYVQLEILPITHLLIPRPGYTIFDFPSVKNNEHVSAKINLQGQDLVFEAVSHNYTFGVYKEFYYHIYDPSDYDWNNKQILTWSYYKKEPYEVNGVRYAPNLSLFGDTLTLTVIEDTSEYKATRVYDLTFSAETVQGGKFNFSDIENNKYTVIDFWGTWCSPCMKSMPKLSKLSKKYQNISFLGLAVDNNLEKVKNAMSEHEIGFPVVQELMFDGDSCLHTQLGVSVYPQYIVFNNEKRIIFRTSDVDELGKYLKKAANE